MSRQSFKEFRNYCASQTQEADKASGRRFNKDSFSSYFRELAYFLFWLIEPSGIRGHHLLFLHFGCDLLALCCIAYKNVLGALTCFFVAHILDGMDGVAARYRNEANPVWGEIDVMFHALTFSVFVVLISYQTESYFWGTLLLAGKWIGQWHRDRFKSQGERWGEQSKLWKWLAYPANVNMIYLAYIVCFVVGMPAEFVKFYAVYFCAIALGQSVHLVIKTLP